MKSFVSRAGERERRRERRRRRRRREGVEMKEEVEGRRMVWLGPLIGRTPVCCREGGEGGREGGREGRREGERGGVKISGVFD